jgi:hypothetical protein
MATSSPSPPKATRSKNGKSNGAGTRALSTDEPDVQKKATASPLVGAGAAPSVEDIARRAYEIYEREGRQPGTELQNWLKAEAELGVDKGH